MTKNYTCPVCGFSPIAKVDTSKSFQGVYVWCRKHKGEVELINRIKEPESEPEPTM